MKGTLTTPSMLRLKESICDGRIYQTRHLLESGVDVNFADEEGLTPLMRAAQLPDEKSRTRHNLLKLLLQHGANVNTVDQQGRHVLSHACMNAKEDIVRLICTVADQDVDLNLQDLDGNTPLMHSVRTGNVDLVKFLLNELKKFQVDIDVRNHEDRTPYLEAKRLGHENCAKILLTEGNASANIQVNPFLEFISSKDEPPLKGQVRSFVDSKYGINRTVDTRPANPQRVQNKKSVLLKESVQLPSDKFIVKSAEKKLKRKTRISRKLTSSNETKDLEEVKDLKTQPRRRKYAWNDSVSAPGLTSRKDEVGRELGLEQPAEAAIENIVNNSSPRAKSPSVNDQEALQSPRFVMSLPKENEPVAAGRGITRAKIAKPTLSRRLSEQSSMPRMSRTHFRSSTGNLAKDRATMDDEYSWYSHFSVYNSSSLAFLSQIMNLYAEQLSPESSFRPGVKPVKPDEPKVPKISVASIPGDDLRSENDRYSPVRSAISSRSNSATSLASSRRFQSAVSRTVNSYLTSKKSLITLKVQDADF